MAAGGQATVGTVPPGEGGELASVTVYDNWEFAEYMYQCA